MPLPEILQIYIQNQLLWGILHHVDLFKDDVPLTLHFAERERRMQHDIRHQVESKWKVFIQDLGIKSDILFLRKGIQYTAHGINRFSDFCSRTADVQ